MTGKKAILVTRGVWSTRSGPRAARHTASVPDAPKEDDLDEMELRPWMKMF